MFLFKILNLSKNMIFVVFILLWIVLCIAIEKCFVYEYQDFKNRKYIFEPAPVKFIFEFQITFRGKTKKIRKVFSGQKTGNLMNSRVAELATILIFQHLHPSKFYFRELTFEFECEANAIYLWKDLKGFRCYLFEFKMVAGLWKRRLFIRVSYWKEYLIMCKEK